MVRHFHAAKNAIKFGDFVNKKIPICDTDDKALTFQIPRLYMPFGISGFAYQGRPIQWNVELALKGWGKDDGYVKKFYDFVKDIENAVIEHVCSQKEVIFGSSSLTDDDIRNMFNSNLKDAANGYEPKLRLKVDTDRDLMTKFKVFNEQHEDITQVVTDGLYARKSVVSVVELASVYFMNRKFGLVWRTAQMQVHEPQRLKGLHIQMPDEPPSP
jgi:hypothetical protein